MTDIYSGKVGGGGNGGSAGDRGKMALQWMVASDGARRMPAPRQCQPSAGAVNAGVEWRWGHQDEEDEERRRPTALEAGILLRGCCS